MTITGPPPRTAPSGKRPERAQAVWQAALRLTAEPAPEGEPRPDDGAAVLAVLRAADFEPSTLRHALTLGRTRLRLRPHDPLLGGGRDLLVEAIAWLGARDTAGEVGPARATGAPVPGTHGSRQTGLRG
jgi:hypothetical protein